MTLEIECPSGLKGKVRGLEGQDGKLLSDQNLIKSNMLMNRILKDCWVETIDPGLYETGKDGAINWLNVLQGDRIYTLLQIAIAGKGHSLYTFPVKCECNERFEYEVDLDDLPVKRLSDSSREVIRQGGIFECIVPGTEDMKLIVPSDDAIELAQMEGRPRPKPRREIVPGTGKTIKFSLPTGADEMREFKLAKQRKRQAKEKNQKWVPNFVTQGILMRTKSIQDVAPSEVESFFDNQSIPRLMELLERLDEFDCGVETVIEIECPDCDRVMQKELPFDESLFLGKRKRMLTES